HLNDSLASINSQSFKGANESTSTNPFGEDDNDDDDDDSIHNGLTREARSRKSFSVMSSSPLQRDGVRSSLPHTARIMTGRKKRQAPLPPSPRPPASSTSSNDRFGHDTSSLSRGGSPLSFNQGAQRKDSTASTSSLTTSPRKTAPPRPPPPKVKNDSPTKK
ncbi:putative actin cytoskeleton-regulatory complex protein PAN1-like 6, partial [Homarus americanus]